MAKQWQQMGRKKIKQPHGGALTPWQKGQTGNPNGRPRTTIRQLADAVGVDFNATLTRADHFAILQALLEFPAVKLEKIAADKEAPAFMAIAARCITQDLRTGSTRTISELYDRLFGKPRQVQELTGPQGGPITYADVADRLNEFYTGDGDSN